MSGPGGSKFSAAAAALGYLYQVRVGLVWALRRLKQGSDFLVSVETLDDVAFETAGGVPEELLQTKHHQSREATLTDASGDLWKSLRVWFETYSANALGSGATLYLLTTAKAPEGSVAARLRAEGRDVDAALKALESTAQISTSKSNADAYGVFLAAPLPVRRALVESVIVIDGVPGVADLGVELRNEVFWAVERGHQDAFLDRLEGWWLRRVLKQLTSAHLSDRISATEIEAQMTDLREQFKQDSLPIDEDLLEFELDEATQAAHAEATFVRQLEIMAAGRRRIAAAVRDYYRAFEQRSRWLRDDLLLVNDLAKYERKLREEWELVFEAAKDEFGEDAAEAAKRKAALQVLKWAEMASVPIRPAVAEPFITRGSLHMLADELRIGWHPDFRLRLAELLAEEETVA
jgi:hypothetical protein